MSSLGSLACGLKTGKAGAPARITCPNAPTHEGQGNFLGGELEHTAAAHTSATSIRHFAFNISKSRKNKSSSQRKGGQLTQGMLLQRLLQILPPILHLFFLHYLVKTQPPSRENITWCLCMLNVDQIRK